MKLPRIVRQIGKRVVKASPILRRHILASSDYRVLGGLQEALSITASASGWLAARTVMRQERAYRSLIAAMKRGEPRLDLKVAAWRSIDDCLATIGQALGDDNGRAAIAHAGQARTMAQHTYRHRTQEILGFAERLRAQR